MYTVEIKGVDKTSIVLSGTLIINKGADNRSDCSFSIITTPIQSTDQNQKWSGYPDSNVSSEEWPYQFIHNYLGEIRLEAAKSPFYFSGYKLRPVTPDAGRIIFDGVEWGFLQLNPVNYEPGDDFIEANHDVYTDSSLTTVKFAKTTVESDSSTEIVGHDVKVKDGSTVIFGGVIKRANISRIEGKTGPTTRLRIDINAESYNDVCVRRTINCNYTNKYAGEIVEYILENVLNSESDNENITAGTISNGKMFVEYAQSYKSVKDIFDQLADASGFKWYIDDSKTLHFIDEDTIADAAHDIVESGEFSDFFISNIESSMDEYRNRQFVVGATDDEATVTYALVDAAETANRKAAEGAAYSSGVYGNVIQDSSIKTEDEAQIVAENALKKFGITPQTLNFTSFTNDWTAGTRLKANLPTFGISLDTYYLIESVTIEEVGGVIKSTITASRRKSSDFSTQRTGDYKDYFAKLATKSGGGAVDSVNGQTGAVDSVNGQTGAVVLDAGDIDIINANDNFTATDVEGALAELFTSVSDGKDLIASAITDKGVATEATDSFSTMATNISNIPSGSTDPILAVASFAIANESYYCTANDPTLDYSLTIE